MRPYVCRMLSGVIVAARKTVAYLEGLRTFPPYQELETHAGLAHYYLEEARDGGGRPALVKAEGHLKIMLALQQPEGYFRSSRTCRGLEFYPEEAGDEDPLVIYPFGYMLALFEYLEYSQQANSDPGVLVHEVKNTCLRFARMLETFCNSTVFRQPSEIRFDRKPTAIIPLATSGIGYNTYILSAGFVFAASERLAGYRGGYKLGEPNCGGCSATRGLCRS